MTGYCVVCELTCTYLYLPVLTCCLQYVIRAPMAGVIKDVPYKVGDTVNKGAALVQFEE